MSGEPEFRKACGLAEVPEEGVIGVQVGDVPVAIVRAEGEVYAVHDVCSHEEVPLSEGEIYDHTVECWLHGSWKEKDTKNSESQQCCQEKNLR